jgi:hypothetical protein
MKSLNYFYYSITWSKCPKIVQSMVIRLSTYNPTQTFTSLGFINMLDENKMGESLKSPKFWMKKPLHG